MSNKYLEELIKLNKELSEMTDEQIMALVDEANVSPEDCAQFARLEKYIINKANDPTTKDEK